jgi:hypothetical protein
VRAVKQWKPRGGRVRSRRAHNDIVFNQPHLPGFFGWTYRLLGSSGGPKVTRVAKLVLVRDHAALRAHLLRLAGTPDLRRVIVMHGVTVRSGAPEMLRAVAGTL